MIFNSIAFLAFLPCALAAYYAAPRRLQNVVLIAASCLFYGWWDWRFLGLLVASTVIDFSIGLALGRTEDRRKRRALIALTLFTNLGTLGFFKYYDFFVDTFAQAFARVGVTIDVPTLNVILPVGISFYTFHTLSYTIDVYWKKIPPTRSFLAFAAYVAFFPQLVAGPISRAKDVFPQFEQRRTLALPVMQDGAHLILWGFFKKVVIADNLDAIVALGYAKDAPGGLALVATYAFAFQIYADFSGYTDIARGLAKIMGFELPLNFDRPYLARSVPEFWKRWHISLSTWFREYLYIPMGGSHRCRARHIFNVMVIFVVSGLWHGANLRFVVWGFIHGLGYLPSVLLRGTRAAGKTRGPLWAIPAWFLTFHFVLVAWIFFRADGVTHGWRVISSVATFIAGGAGPAPPLELILRAAALGGGLLVVEWLRRGKAHTLELDRTPLALRLAATAAIFLAIMVLGNFDNVPFIYFQF